MIKIDYKKLEEGLPTLTGHDFEMAEKQERAAGNFTPDLTFSRSFLARLGSFALGVNVHDLKDLPLNEYAQVTQKVNAFLYSGSATEENASSESGE